MYSGDLIGYFSKQGFLCRTAEFLRFGVVASYDRAFQVQVTKRAEDTSLVRDLHQQLNKQEQELQGACSEALHLHTETL